MDNFWYYFLQLTIGFVSVIPLACLIISTNNRPLSVNKQLLYGVLSIALSAFYFAFLSDGLNRFESANVKPEEATLKVDVVNAFGVWVFIVPAVYLGVGINLVSNFIISNRPNA